MKTFIRLIKIVISSSLAGICLAYGLSYFFHIKIVDERDFIQQLKIEMSVQRDLYMMCMIDYHINPNGKDIINECKKLESNLLYKIAQLKEN